MEEVSQEDQRFTLRLSYETTHLCIAQRDNCKYLVISEISPMTTVNTEETSFVFAAIIGILHFTTYSPSRYFPKQKEEKKIHIKNHKGQR